MTLFQEECEAFIEPRWHQSLILVKTSIYFKLLPHWAKIRALELKWNLLLATLDPFVSIFSTVSLLCALCIQPFIAELLWFSRFWVKEETGKTPQYFSAAWHKTTVNLRLTWSPDVFTLVLSCLALSSIAAALPWDSSCYFLIPVTKQFLFSSILCFVKQSVAHLVNLTEVPILFVKIRGTLKNTQV